MSPALRSLLLLFLTSTTLLGSGCQYLRPGDTAADAAPVDAAAATISEPQPPDFVEIRATGRAGDDGEVSWPAALSHEFTAQSNMLHDETLTSPGLKLLVARAAGRQAALRRLAEKVLATSGTSETTLAQALAADPAQPARLREWLGSKAEVTWQDATTSTLVTVTVQGAGLAEHLGLIPTADKLSPEAIDTLRRAALDNAMEQARTELRAKLLETQLEDGTLAADFFGGRKSASRELDALIFIVQPDEIRQPDPHTAEVTIFFDRNLVRELAKTSGAGWWTRLLGR